MIERSELTATLDDHQKAFTEVCFLLEVLNDTISQVIGQSTASVGIAAGRHMAKKMPIYLVNPTLEDVLAALVKRLDNGFAISFGGTDKGASIDIGRCAIRDVCQNRQLDLGGQLCTMFHHYLAGMTAEFLGKPVRAGAIAAGPDQCTFPLEAK